MSYLPALVPEWDLPAPWTTCTLSSGTMGAAKASSGQVPATAAERDRLWSAVGRGYSGYTSAQLRAGQAKLYGHAPAHYTGSWSTLRQHLLDPGLGVVLYGSYPKLPLAIRNGSKQTGYSGLHAIYAQGAGSGELVIVGDPLSKGGLPSVDVDALRPYAAALSYEHDTYTGRSWETMTTITIERSWSPPQVATFAGPATYRGYHPTSPEVVATVGIGTRGSSAPIDAYALIEQANPATIPHGHFVRVTAGPLAKLWVPITGISLPPEAKAIDPAALLLAAGQLRAVADALAKAAK